MARPTALAPIQGNVMMHEDPKDSKSSSKNTRRQTIGSARAFDGTPQNRRWTPKTQHRYVGPNGVSGSGADENELGGARAPYGRSFL